MEVNDTMDPAQEFEAKLVARTKPLHELTALGNSTVQQFYKGSIVFITGGSGFLGKQLIEKLFRATKISKIFILLRSKKGKSIDERLVEILRDPVYDLLREQQPDFEKKLVPISGDTAELRLGLSDKDWNAIAEKVNIVFHLAATTRFDEPLRTATLINIRGTREILMLGKACKNLRSFVYVSTAYSYATADRINTVVSEFFYKTPVSPDIMIQMAETVDEERMNNITPSLIKDWPNTYTFAKSIAEDLVNSIGRDLPLCVVRPSIVIGSKLEPNPGWVDMSCIYGASGLFVTVGLGVTHTALADPTKCLDFIPVDYVNNAIIAAGWKTAKNQDTGVKKTKIYAVTSSSQNPCIYENLMYVMDTECRKYQSPMMVGYPFAWVTTNPIIFWIYSWLLHLIPAHILDGIAVIIGKKKRFAKQANKLYKMSKALSYFNCNQWEFENQNTAALLDSLSKEDRQIFNFDVKEIDWTEYIITWCIGLRKYILKDGLNGTLYARKKITMMGFLTLVFLPLYFYCLFRIMCFPFSLIMNVL